MEKFGGNASTAAWNTTKTELTYERSTLQMRTPPTHPPSIITNERVWVHEWLLWSRNTSSVLLDLKRYHAHSSFWVCHCRLSITLLRTVKQEKEKWDLSHKKRFLISKVVGEKIQGTESRQKPNSKCSPNVLFSASADSFAKNRLRHCVLHAHPPYLYLYKSCFPNTTCPISTAYHSLTLSTPYSLTSSSEEILNGVPNTNFHTHWPHICWPLIISSNSSFCHLIIPSFPQKEYIFLMGMDCVLCFSSALSPYRLHITEHMINQIHHIFVKEGKNITSNNTDDKSSPENLNNFFKFNDTDSYRTMAITITLWSTIQCFSIILADSNLKETNYDKERKEALNIKYSIQSKSLVTERTHSSRVWSGLASGQYYEWLVSHYAELGNCGQ